MTQKNLFKQATLVVAGIAVSAIGAHAQTHLMSTNGTIVAATGDLAPSGGGATFNALNIDTGTMDDAGNLFFRGQLIGVGVTPQNQRAYYVGTDRASLTQVIRSADPVPTLTGGETLNTATSTGIGGTTRFAPNGSMFWTGTMTGGASTTANDTAIFTGTPGSFIIAAREGDAAPGTVGATMNGSLGGLGFQGTSYNGGGRIAFQSSTLGGDTTTANNAAWFGGVPGSLEMIVRKGASIPSGEVIGSLGFNAMLNASGQVFHDEALSTVLGTPPAIAANNAVLMVYTPGMTPGTGTNAILLREGDPAPAGTVGAIMGVTSAFSGPFGFGSTPFNNSGKALISVALFPGVGDAVLNVNDNILYLTQAGGPTSVVMRKGDAAPGLGGGELFATVNTSNTVLNNNDRFAFAASLSGGSVTTANDQSVWFGSVGNLQMIVREGDPAPGTVGATIGDMMGQGNFYLNDMDQVTFQTNLVGGDVVSGNSQMLYSWSPATGLTPVLRGGDQIEFTPGVFKTATTWGGLQFTNGDCRPLAFTQGGKLHMGVNFSDSTKALMTVYLPKQLGTPFCSGDGTGTACPCGNSGLAGRGCANFSFAQGAKLTATGVAGASTLNDTLVLTASEIPGPGLFFQGTGTFGGGLSFGDGLLCAGGTIVRLGVVFPTGTSASFPGGLTPAPVHIAGGTIAGDVRNYQVWYRDSGETSPGISFCTPSTFNLTEGLTITWGP